MIPAHGMSHSSNPSSSAFLVRSGSTAHQHCHMLSIAASSFVQPVVDGQSTVESGEGIVNRGFCVRLGGARGGAIFFNGSEW